MSSNSSYSDSDLPRQQAPAAPRAWPSPPLADPGLFEAHGIAMWRGALPADRCDRLLSYLDMGRADHLKLLDDADMKGHGGPRGGRFDPTVRNAKTVSLAPVHRSLHSLLSHQIAELVEPLFRCRVTEREEPQLLAYEAGGFYRPHWDGVEKQADGSFRRVLNRDISLILYLNDAYTGGRLDFPDRGVSIHPETGMLLAFPSGPHHRHGAEPVTSGLRLAIVTWMAAEFDA